MGQKKANAKEEQPGYVTYLLEHGSVILRSDIRDGFGEMINQIPANIRYAAGAVGKDTLTGLYELRIDLVTND